MAKSLDTLTLDELGAMTLDELAALPLEAPVVRPTGLVSLSAGGSFQAPVPIYPPEIEPAVKTFLRPRHFQGCGFGSSYQPPTPMILTPQTPQWPAPVGEWLPEPTIFNGTSDSLIIQKPEEILQSLPMSFSIWCQPTKRPAPYSVAFATNAWGQHRMFVSTENNNQLFLKVALSTGQIEIAASIGLTTANRNDWHHLAMTWDTDRTLTGYLNGVQFRTSSIWIVGTALPNWSIGADYSGNSWFFEGGISNIGVWKVKLTDAEILALYNAQLPTVTG